MTTLNSRVDRGPTVWKGSYLPTFGYHNLVTNMNVQAMPSAISNNAALGIGVALTAEQKQAAHDASVFAAQTATANDYHKSKSEMSATLQSLGGTDAEIAECAGKVINAFNQTEVNSMKACFAAKIEALKKPETAEPTNTPGDENTSVGASSGTGSSSSGSMLSSLNSPIAFGLSPVQIGAGVIILLGASYVGYNLYKNYSK